MDRTGEWHEDIYKMIFEQLRDIVVIFDVMGNIIKVNQAALMTYGYTAEDVKGKHVRDLRAVHTREDISSQLESAHQKGFCFRTVHVRKNGHEFPVEVNSKRISLQGEHYIVSIIRDITKTVSIEQFLQEKEETLQSTYQELLCAHEELMASNEELQQQFESLQVQDVKIARQNVYLQALHDTTRSLMQGNESDGLLQHLLISAAKLVGASHGAIYQMDEQSQTFVRTHGMGLYQNQTGVRIPNDYEIIGMVYQKKATLIVNDYVNFRKQYPTHSLLFAFDAVMLIPLIAAGEIIGVIGLAYYQKNKRFGAEEEEVLTLFAELASVALDNRLSGTLAQKERKNRKQAEAELSFVDRKYQAIFNSASEGIILYGVRSKRLLDMNPVACEMFGFSGRLSQEDGSQQAVWQKYITDSVKSAMQKALKGRPQLIDYKIVAEKQQECWLQMSIKRIDIGKEACLLGMIRDITQKKEYEKTILQMAYYDALTGLPNRRLLNERLQQELEKVQKQESAGGAVFFIDLDDFKTVNDTLGHSYGDRVIVEAGKQLMETLGEEAMVARVGGDEFSILLPDEIIPDRIAKVAEKLLKALSYHYEFDALHTYLSASIGVALYPEHGETLESVYKNADLAMYKAKENKKNSWVLFQHAWQDEAYENMMLKQDLRKAMEKKEFFLQYQPIVCMKTQRVVCFEALVRWQHPEYGVVPPDRFLPMVEELHMMSELGEWIIGEACAFVNRLNGKGYEDVTVAVNLSPSQFMQHHFAENTICQITAAGIHARQLEFEITENLLIASLEESRQQLSKFREKGIRLALDDFGTGYSSLTYLQSLPVSKLKIDKSFIDVASSAKQLSLLQSMIHMAHSLQLHVVAEGVETQSQVEMMHKCSCDYVQGYFYSRPLGEAAALAYLEAEIQLFNG